MLNKQIELLSKLRGEEAEKKKEKEKDESDRRRDAPTGEKKKIDECVPKKSE